MKEINEMTRETIQELIEKPDDFSFEDLLDPYREGGTLEQPARRTWGTISLWLIDKLKFSPEIAGAAIFMVCLEMRNGLKFEGDGEYGSPGRDLVHYIRQTAITIRQKRAEEQIFGLIGRKFYGQMEGYISEQIKKAMKPWWRRIF